MVTNAAGETTEQYEAVWTNTNANSVAQFLAGNTTYIGDKVAKTTYSYAKTRLSETRVYTDIAANAYLATTYDYETFASGTGCGRLLGSQSPGGTITRNVLDASGNILSTWIGTDDTGAKDADPSNGGQNTMVRVSANVYNADGSLQTAFKETDNVQETATPVTAADVYFTPIETGTTYLMYSEQSVHSRFADFVGGSGDSFIAVVYDDGQWKYDNNAWPQVLQPFVVLPTDVLVAAVNFTDGAYTLTRYYDQKGFINGIEKGYGGDTDGLAITLPEDGCLTVSGTSFVQNTSKSATTYGYDWQNRPLWTMVDDGTYQTYTYNTYDNYGRVTETRRFWDVDGDIADNGPEIGVTAGCDKLLAQSTVDYDNLSRVYQTTTYAVDVSNIDDVENFPDVGLALSSNTWYDAAGRVIKSQPAGSNTFTKTVYDGLGRTTFQYVGYDADELPSDTNAYAKAQDLDGDTIFEQSQIDYDAVGNVIFSTAYQRNHDAAGTGELTTFTARATYAGYWYDGIGRSIATANYGTNDGDVMSARPATPPDVTSTNALVAKTEYVYADVNVDNQTEYVVKSLSPTSAGAIRTDWAVYDAAGRVTKTVQNAYDGNYDGLPDAPDADFGDRNVTVLTTYNAGGQVETYTAVNPKTGNQTTRYYYGTTLADSDVARGDLLRAVMYPDSDDTASGGTFGPGADGLYDRVEYQYNRLGQQKQAKDQNQTVHDYIFDQFGRQTSDQATLSPGNPQNIDDGVLRIDYEYEVRGMVNRVTSRDASNAVVDEVFREFNAFGLLTAEYQDHDSAVPNPASGPHVEYTYEDGSNNTVRPTGIVYPNGRQLHYNYASGNDNALSRITSITDNDNTVLASYTYLGLGQVLAVSYPVPGVSYDLTQKDANGQYDRLDQFGRVNNAYWTDGANALVDLRYGYDLAGNRIWREDAAADGFSEDFDERYWYDSMNQLVDMQRGDLDFTNPTNPTIVGGDLSQQWELDATGNWNTVTTGGTPQDRTHDAANQMTEIDDSSALLHYDAAGNMTLMPQPGNASLGYNLKWDAWNRLVKVTSGSGASEKTVAEYRYDGLNRRIVKKTFDTEGALLDTRHFYLSDQNQVLEERVDSRTVADRQNVWGLRYIDDLVLRDRDTTGNGTLDQRHYAMQDANWNVVAIASAEGDMVERYTFTAYGKCEVRMDDFTPDADGKSNVDWRSLYTTREFDPETGLYYYRARYYYAEMGRFVGRDPAEADISLYRYCGSNPADATDPFGMEEWQDSSNWWYLNIFAYGPLRWGVNSLLTGYSQSQDRSHELDAQRTAADPNRSPRAGDSPTSLTGESQCVAAAKAQSEINQFGRDRVADGCMSAAGGVVSKCTQCAKANTVYRSVNAAGEVRYVGITNNLARRAAEHLASKGIQIEKLMGNLSRSDARAVEQSLIEIHGLGASGGTLLNKINSIARTNPAYADQLRRGHNLLKTVGY